MGSFDLGFGDFLQARGASFGVVLGGLALLLHLFDAVHLVAAHVADRHARLLGFTTHQLHVLAPALFRQRRDCHPDDLTVARPVAAPAAFVAGVLYDPALALVLYLDDQRALPARAVL